MTEDDALRARLDRMEAQLAAMSARLAALEGGPKPLVLHAEPIATMPTVPEDPAQEYEDEPAAAPAPKAPAVDWERLIGGRWSLWVGAFAIFLAMAFFLAYAWQFLTPVPRVMAGFAAGSLLLGVAAWVRRRADPWFAEGLAGAGLGLFYLSVWAAFSNYGLLTARPAFALLLGVTALGSFIALRYDAKSQMALATGGGFLTPLVLDAADVHGLTLALYALVLDVGLLAISFRKRWPGVAWACLAGTIVLGHMAHVTDQAWLAFGLATAAFALFATTAVGYSLRRGEKTLPHDVLLLFASAFYYAPIAYWLLHDKLGDFPLVLPLALTALFVGVGQLARAKVPDNRPFRMAADALAILFLTLTLPAQLDYGWLAVGWAIESALLGAFALREDEPVFRQASRVVGVAAAGASLMVFVNEAVTGGEWQVLNPHSLPLLAALAGGVGLVAYARRLGKPGGVGVSLALVLAALGWSHIEATVFFVTEAVTESVARHGIERLEAGLDALLGAGLIALGVWSRTPPLKAGGLVVWGFAVCLLLFSDPDASRAALADGRPFATLAVLAGGALGLRALRRDPAEGQAAWTLGLAIATVLVAVWGLSVESYALVRSWAMAGWERQAQLAVSLAWIASGVVVLSGGVRAGSRPFRLLGLGLLGASVLKVFLFDVSSLDTPYRIGAFAGLGAALIGISWLYGRYGVGQAEAAPPEDPRP